MSTTRRPRARRHRPVCLTTGKVRYRDRKDAKLALRAAVMLRARSVLDGVECSWTVASAYRCTDCNGGYHLTSLVHPTRTGGRDVRAGAAA